MKLKLIAALMLGALVIATPGCGTSEAGRHMHHQTGHSTRRRVKFHSHGTPARDTMPSVSVANPAADK